MLSTVNNTSRQNQAKQNARAQLIRNFLAQKMENNNNNNQNNKQQQQQQTASSSSLTPENVVVSKKSKNTFLNVVPGFALTRFGRRKTLVYGVGSSSSSVAAAK